MKRIWHDIPVGTIVDSDIAKLAEAGELITGAFDPRFLKQACYELRASDIFYDVASLEENRRILVSAGTGYLLKPNCSVVCIVMERLRLPTNVLGRILTKGKLFSVGILPVNTYADPGFEGRLGITLYNASRRYIMIRPGEAIAKIELEVLPKSVSNPYAGQHGYETEIWPIAHYLFANLKDGSVTKMIGNDYDELAISYGPRIAEMFRQLQFYRIGVWLQLLAILIGFSILFALQGQIGLLWSLGIGIAANLLTKLMLDLWVGRKGITKR